MVRITIVGMKPNQSRSVESHFAGMCMFTFIPAGRCNTQLPSRTEWVIISRWTGHRWSEAAFHQFPRRRVKFCRGGIASILRLVRFILGDSDRFDSAA
jgi:hypothetical protein